MRAGDWEGAFDEARAAEEAAAARHEERAAVLRARLESGLRKVSGIAGQGLLVDGLVIISCWSGATSAALHLQAGSLVATKIWSSCGAGPGTHAAREPEAGAEGRQGPRKGARCPTTRPHAA